MVAIRHATQRRSARPVEAGGLIIAVRAGRCSWPLRTLAQRAAGRQRHCSPFAVPFIDRRIAATIRRLATLPGVGRTANARTACRASTAALVRTALKPKKRCR